MLNYCNDICQKIEAAVNLEDLSSMKTEVVMMRKQFLDNRDMIPKNEESSKIQQEIEAKFLEIDEKLKKKGDPAFPSTMKFNSPMPRKKANIGSSVKEEMKSARSSKKKLEPMMIESQEKLQANTMKKSKQLEKEDDKNDVFVSNYQFQKYLQARNSGNFSVLLLDYDGNFSNNR